MALIYLELAARRGGGGTITFLDDEVRFVAMNHISKDGKFFWGFQSAAETQAKIGRETHGAGSTRGWRQSICPAQECDDYDGVSHGAQ